MKRILFAFLAFGLLYTGSCKLIDKLTRFYVDYDAQVVYAAGLPVGLPLTIYSPEVTTNATQNFESNNTRADLVKSIKLNQMSLNITSPQGQTFSFLQSVSVYISAPNLPEVEIAGKQNIPSNAGSQLSLDVNDVELKSYISSDSIQLRVSSTSNQILTQDVYIDVYSKFYVQADVLKAL
ncbi:MAG TPA: hypothetical protein VG603_07760 [Chitinophagales bacterium]|nr:hypothetical protein [Chitinophagales bacterium]